MHNVGAYKCMTLTTQSLSGLCLRLLQSRAMEPAPCECLGRAQAPVAHWEVTVITLHPVTARLSRVALVRVVCPPIK